jgi:phage-related protein
MPAALPFSTSISQSSGISRKNRLLSAQFGDGYSQELPAGINANFDVWEIKWNPTNVTDTRTLTAALDVGLYDYMTWQSPLATATQRFKVVKDSVKVDILSGALYQVSCQLRQVF